MDTIFNFKIYCDFYTILYFRNENKSGVKGKPKKYILKQKLNDTLLKVPEQGNFDLQTVLKSTYFFS